MNLLIIEYHLPVVGEGTSVVGVGSTTMESTHRINDR